MDNTKHPKYPIIIEDFLKYYAYEMSLKRMNKPIMVKIDKTKKYQQFEITVSNIYEAGQKTDVCLTYFFNAPTFDFDGFELHLN